MYRRKLEALMAPTKNTSGAQLSSDKIVDFLFLFLLFSFSPVQKFEQKLKEVPDESYLLPLLSFIEPWVAGIHF